MKKLLPLLAALLMLLTACGQPTQTAQEPPTPQDGEAWVKYFSEWLPVSVVENGEQILALPAEKDEQNAWYFDEKPWYFEVYRKLGLSDDFPGVNLPDPLTGGHIDDWQYHELDEMFAVNSANPAGLTEEGWLTSYTWDEKSMFGGLALSGDWQPFITPVRFEEYAPDDQPENLPCRDKLLEILRDKAAYVAGNEDIDKVPVPPFLAKCAYYFDVDGDGREECLLNLGNLARYQTDAPNPPADDNSLIYALTVYISGSGEVTVLDDRTGYTIPAKPLYMDEENPENDIYYGYLPPEQPTDLWWEQYDAAYFADAEGRITPSPIYICGEFSNAPELHLLLADIDGDGRAELLTSSTFIYYPLTVYDFDGDKIIRRFAMTTPA